MNEWCSCNRLREAEAALTRACEELVEAFGTCPSDKFGWDLEECGNSCQDEYVECWRKALIRKARRNA